MGESIFNKSCPNCGETMVWNGSIIDGNLIKTRYVCPYCGKRLEE